MLKTKNSFVLNLQLFADGGEGANGEGGTNAQNNTTAENNTVLATPTEKGVKNPLADVKYGIQEDAQTADVQTEEEKANAEPTPEERNAKFDELIKGEYKDLYDAKVQNMLSKRLRGAKETTDKLNSIMPLIDALSQRYGIDTDDVNGLIKAFEDDNAFYEQEALDKGISVEDLKSIRKNERETARLKARERELTARENADRQYAEWMNQAQELQKVYPGFNLNEELQEQKFVDLIRNNIDIRTAYEVVHKDEIIPAAMQFAVKKATQKMANNIIANGARPAENGTSSTASAIVKSDVSQLSKADIAEINRRVQRGEKIRF